MSTFKIKAAELKREIEIMARKVTRWSYDHLPPGICSFLCVLFFIGCRFWLFPYFVFWLILVGLLFDWVCLHFLGLSWIFSLGLAGLVLREGGGETEEDN